MSAGSVLVLAASDKGIQTRGGGTTGSNTVLRPEKFRQLSGLKDTLVKVVGLGTQVRGEGFAVAGLEGTQVVNMSGKVVTLSFKLTEQLRAASLGVSINPVGVALSVGGQLLSINTGAGLDALSASLGVNGELMGLGFSEMDLTAGLILSLTNDALGIRKGKLNHPDDGRGSLSTGGDHELLDSVLGGSRLVRDRGSSTTSSEGLGVTKLRAETLILTA